MSTLQDMGAAGKIFRCIFFKLLIYPIEILLLINCVYQHVHLRELKLYTASGI